MRFYVKNLFLCGHFDFETECFLPTNIIFLRQQYCKRFPVVLDCFFVYYRFYFVKQKKIYASIWDSLNC